MPSAFKEKSPSLPELQRWMRGVLTHPAGVERALAQKDGRRFVQVIGESPELQRAERLAIYGNGYFSRLIDCLGANFEAVKNVLGYDDFYELGRDYLIRYPSRYKCIDDVGREFPSFIKRRALSKSRPYLAELATLEWAVHEAVYTDDLPPFDPQKFAGLSPREWSAAKIILDPSVRLLKLKWPVDELWRADGKWGGKRLNNLKASNYLVLVYRREDKLVRAPRLTEDQYKLLGHFQDGKTLGKSIAALPQTKTLPLKDWFNNWASLGVIRNIA